MTSAVALLIAAIGFTVFGVGAASGRIDAGTGAKSAAAAHPARVASHARASVRTQAPAATRAAIQQNGLHVSRPGAVITRVLATTVGPIGTAAGFEDNDGNLAVDNGNTDWNSFSSSWTGTAPYQMSSGAANGFTFLGLTDAVATTSDSAFAGGVKQNDVCPLTPPSKSPNKDDLQRAYVAYKVVGGMTYLELAWVRIPQNTTSADAHIAFEFNQSKTPCANGDGLVQRTDGDLLVLYDFQSGSATISLAKWSGTAWGTPVSLTANGTAEAAVNPADGTVDTVSPNPPQTLGALEFGEAGINLTAAIGSLSGGGRACEQFGNVYALSRSSGSSDTAQMEDIVGPAPLNISNCATPTLATTPNPASGNLGATLNDTADLSGANSPTGSVTFKLYGPSDPTCSGTALYTETDALSGTHAATTGGPAVNTAGTYHWTASYPGDGNNNAASSTCASEAVTIAKATPTIATTPNPASAIVGANLNDTAHVSGGSSPTGNVTFSLFGPADATCSGTALYTKTVALSGSDAATTDGPAVSTAGVYHWTATYNGDGNNNTASSSCASEAVTVGKGSPTIATTPNPSSATVGAALNDTAHVSGGSSPTGTVTFSLFGPADATCSGTAVYTKTVALSGSDAATTDGPASAATGTYHWTATYNGDGNNNAASSTCASEPVTVGKASPTIATTPNPASAIVGAALNDTAHVSGGSSPSGNVTFKLYGPADASCSGTALYTKTVALSGSDAATTDGPASALTGTYHWTATYNGDGNNNAASSTCASEPVAVGKASPTIATTPNPASAVVGAALNDTAHVSDGFSPTGNVTFSLYGPADATCSGTALYTKTVSLSGRDAATTDGPAVNIAGTYHWTATYNGDGNNNTASSSCASEAVDVGKGSPTIATTPNPASATVGAALNDTAHVSGGSSPTGNVTFNLYSPADATCTGTALYTKTVALSGSDAATSDGPASSVAGTYHWTATYNGDANNSSASSTCASEPVDVGKASPAVATTPNPASATVGADLNDTAQVTGGFSPTGDVTFSLYGPADATCSGTALYTKTVALAGGGAATSDGPASTLAGTYHWTATYNGDGNNKTASSTCASEPVAVGKASPTIATTPSPSSASVGAALNDTAHVSDGFSPTGDVTFSLFGPADADCTGNALYTKTVALSGRDAATSDGPTVDTAGTYHWTATYNGDGNNDTASSTCASEAVDVGKASPSIATKLSTGEIVVGTFAHDSSTLTGATSDAGGTATYTVYTNNTCTDGARPAGTVAVSGGDVNDSDSVQFNAAGDYYWQVVYNGDNNNSSAKSACNSEDNEHLLVDKPSISITKNPKAQAIDSGGTATFTITVTNTGTTNLTGVTVSDGQAPGCAKSIGTLNKGESSTYTCSLAGVTSSFTNSATATGHPPVGPDVTATDTAPVTVNAVPPPPPPAPPAPPAPKIDLSITKSGSPNPATLGNRITWTETVMNAGPSPATGVKVADAIPAGTTFVSVTTSLGTCTGGALVSCSLGNMGVGQTATITIVTTANVTGTIPNTATVVGNEAETNTANNTASASVVVKGKFVPPVTYCTAVAVSPKSLFVGRTNTLTLKVTQHGKAKAGIKVHVQGSTIRLTTKPSNGKGVVKQTVKPMKAGIVIFKPVAVSSCKNARVGVIGVFTPPVTG